jgi:hypothetical protein
VLRTFRVSDSPADGVFVEIVGRASGIIAWALTIVGIHAETSLRVTRTEILYRRASLFGEVQHFLPLPHASHTYCGYVKPLWYLALAVISVLLGLWAPSLGRDDRYVLLAGLLIGAIFFVVYWLQKKVAISVVGSDSIPLGLQFKRSVIESVPVDIDKALQAIELLNRRILESHVGEKFAEAVEQRRSGPARPERFARARTTSGYSRFCTACGAGIVGEQRFCPTCGAALA